jgi:RimJ/RimL family protein N-acetyltransferase
MVPGGLDPCQIRTPRLKLRRLRPEDAELIALFAGDAKVARMTTRIPHPYPPGMAEAFVARAARPSQAEEIWALDPGTEADSGLIGLISLKTSDGNDAEIGYWVAPALWGAGYATEAVRAIVDEARRRDLRAVVARVFQNNSASIRVLLRCGFEYVGEGEIYSVANGGMVPTFRYRLDLDDPQVRADAP